MAYDPMQAQMAQASALRQPTQSPTREQLMQFGLNQPSPSPGIAPAPTGMQTLATPLDPNGGMQMNLDPNLGVPTGPGPTGMPLPGSSLQPPMTFDQYKQNQGQGYGRGGRFGGPGGPGGMGPNVVNNPNLYNMQGQQHTLGGYGGTISRPGGPGPNVVNNPNLYAAQRQQHTLGGPPMQGLPGQVAPLQPQGTAPSPAGAARPGTPPGAPNPGIYR